MKTDYFNEFKKRWLFLVAFTDKTRTYRGISTMIMSGLSSSNTISTFGCVFMRFSTSVSFVTSITLSTGCFILAITSYMTKMLTLVTSIYVQLIIDNTSKLAYIQVIFQLVNSFSQRQGNLYNSLKGSCVFQARFHRYQFTVFRSI